MTALATIIGRGLHSVRPAAGTAGSIYYETDTSTLFRDNGASWDSIEGAGGGSSTLAGDTDVSISSPAAGQHLYFDGTHWVNVGPSVTQLDYAAATDIANNVTLPLTTWTDLGTNQSFTVDDANSIILIAVSGNTTLGGGNGSRVGSRIQIDSAGTPVNKRIGGMYVRDSSDFGNPLAGSSIVRITGLSAGTHTVKTQLYTDLAAQSFWCRASTMPNVEALQILVLEVKR